MSGTGKTNFALMFLVLASLLFLAAGCPQTQVQERSGGEGVYNPQINPGEFTSSVTNKYFSLIPGKKMVFESKVEEGKKRIEVFVTNEKKFVAGIEAVVVWDRVWLNDELIEDTRDWYAQDKEGNVWYLGEDTKEMIDCKVVNMKGSWETGVDGAKPGIVMLANPRVGQTYRQEFFAGEAEDMADVIALDEAVDVPFGKFKDCIRTLDYTPLEPDVREYKYYCSEVSGVALEVGLGSGEWVELVSVEYGAEPGAQGTEPEAGGAGQSERPQNLTTGITEAQAREIALREVPGIVTDVSIERKYGKIAYVVEIKADADGTEKDVIIDASTGQVLGVER